MPKSPALKGLIPHILLTYFSIFLDEGEKDLIVMHHEIGVQWQDSKKETKNIDFVVYGDPKGYSAMAATVGFPTGIATKMILDGKGPMY